MLNNKLTMVINTCEKFSDIWDGHIILLNQNWKDRNIKTLLLTDEETDKTYPGIEVISAGSKAELSDRLRYAMNFIDTEYILITLDDYYPIHKIDTGKIVTLIQQMDEYKLDYLRLFKIPNSKKKLGNTKSLYEIDLNGKKDTHYQINLYSGIWRKSFLEKAVQETMNAWEFELSLTKLGRSLNMNCAMSKGEEFKILDVVRKGQLLHKSNRYLKKHQLYNGDRTVISMSTEIKLNMMKLIKRTLPQREIDFGKSILKKFGCSFYSDKY